MSPYGTFDQGGNLLEWNEGVDLTVSSRLLRGGDALDFIYGSLSMRAVDVKAAYPSDKNTSSGTFGFRVASTTELQSADFDGSGTVDGDDFLKWQRGMSPNPYSQADLALWESQYGGAPPLVSVPEPATCALALVVLCMATDGRTTEVDFTKMLTA